MTIKRLATLLGILVLLSLVLSACAQGPTQAQIVADLCLRGNEAACEYHEALVAFEKAEKNLAEAKEEYEASLATATPEGGDN